MQIFVEADAQPALLSGEKIAVLGYGSQGRAHALNLRDSGYDVVVGLRPGGKTSATAERDGLPVKTPAEAAKGAGLVAFLAPDMAQAQLYKDIEPQLKKGATLLFAHGFNIHYKQIQPRADLDVVLIAPKGPGDLVRRQYEQGRGVPCLLAVAQDATGKAQARALAYAHGIGGTRGGVLEDDVRRRDRDGSVRRASRALRRRDRARREAASRRWSRPAISPRSPTSSACTS